MPIAPQARPWGTKRIRRAVSWWLVYGSAAITCGACGGREGAKPHGAGDGSGHIEQPLVELFSWWTQPGEAEALQALVNAHQAHHPTARIFNAAAASGAKARGTLHDRLLRADPPDLMQENAHDLHVAANRSTELLEPLDDTFDALGLRRVVFPGVIADVTLNGHILAMPVNIHRENSLFYNRAIFAAHSIAPPTTLDEFLEACRVLKAAGIIPVATAYQGWILRIMLNSIAMAKMGTDRYRDFFTGKSQDAAPLLREAIVVFKDVLEHYVNSDASEEGFNWTNAAQAVFNGDAAMFLHGDWAKGYFVQLGWTPGKDFGVVGAPGASDLFLYQVDVFAMPKGAPNARGAREFLGTIASIEGQVAFSELKGSIPIRLDAPANRLDVLGQATLHDFQTARIRMLLHDRPEWDDAIGTFAKTKDVDVLLRVYLDNPPDG